MKRMTTEWETAKCKNCRRKLGDDREIIKSGSGVWVHNNPINYDLKCHPFHQYVAEPLED